MLRATLVGLRHSTGNPLARELRFQIILFGITVLKYSSTLSTAASWRLKDDILSAGLSWFAFAPRWSFGGNRLQLKAETKLLADVVSALRTVKFSTEQGTPKTQNVSAKEELLELLLENEQSRLKVWLYPLEEGGLQSGAGYKLPSDVSVTLAYYLQLI
jgi:phosphatidylinositol 4-kinase